MDEILTRKSRCACLLYCTSHPQLTVWWVIEARLHPITFPIIATVLYALTLPHWNLLFLLSSDTQAEVCNSPQLSAPHLQFKLNYTELIISIDKSMVSPAQAAKNLVWLQLLCESHMATTAQQHIWNQILPSSPGTMPLMAVNLIFFCFFWFFPLDLI